MTVEAPRRRRLVFEMAKRPDLQGMRAVAVLAVFADHLLGWPAGGFLGVDVFFVLSGFFITGLLLKERSYTGEVSFRNFYIRRVRRIIPSALLVLAGTVVGAFLLFPAARAKSTLLDALYAAIFASNFRFEAVGADYFAQGLPPSPIQHYWSLSIEEQFYFVWPLLLVILFAATRKIYRRGNLAARQWGLFTPMALIVAASFGWALWLSSSDPNAAYFSTFTRVWELGVGALLAIAGPWLARIPAGMRPALAYFGLGGVVVSLFVINSTSQWPAPWAALPVLSTALVVASFHGADVRAVPMLTNPVAGWFGDTSYTLYLWHWPVIVLLLAVIPEGGLFYVLAAAISLGLTALTYHFYENPIRDSNWLNGRRRIRRGTYKGMELSRWGLIGVVVAATFIVSILYIHQVDRTAGDREAIAAAQDDEISATSFEEANPCFGAPAMVTEGCTLFNPDENLVPGVDNLAADRRGQLECYRTAAEPDTLKVCQFGYTGPDATPIALVGDSHAAALLPALIPTLKENKWRLTTYTGVGCAWAYPAVEGCRGLLPQIQTALVAQRYELVITTNQNRRQLTPRGHQVAWEPVLNAGIRIAAVADNPAATEESMACLTRIGGGDLGDCGTPRSDAFPIPDTLTAAARSTPAVTLIDFSKYYCTAERCPSIIGNAIVYRDASDLHKNSHLTATFARTLAPALQDGLLRAFESTSR